MKLVWHIIRKDLRRHWLGYFIWLGMLVAKIALCAKALTSASADAEWFERLQLYYGLTAAIASVTGFLLAASFALDDELVGSRMFWSTRPISGLRLLAAKSIGLVLFFVAVPVLVWVPWWLYCGSGVRELYVAAMMMVLTHGVPTLLALLVSALTGKSSRFLLLLLSALLLSMVTGLLSTGRTFALSPEPIDVALARDIMALLLCAGGVFGAIGLQYRTRRTGWSTLVLVVGFGLGIWALKAWPWAFTQTWRGETKSDVGVEAVELRLVSLSRPTETSQLSLPPDLARLRLKFNARGVPEEVRFSSGRARVTLTFPDGSYVVQETRLRSTAPEWIARSTLGVGPDIQLTDPETKAFVQQRIAEAKAKRGATEVPQVGVASPSIELTGDLIVLLTQAERFERERPDCRAEVELGFRRPVVQLETPLMVDAEAAGRGARVRVVADLLASKLKDVSNEESYAVVHYDAVHESWLNAIYQRSSGAMTVRSGPRIVGKGPFFVHLAPFSREIVTHQRPKVRRGEAWVLAPGADEVPTLVVASYEGNLDAQRQCVLPAEQGSR